MENPLLASDIVNYISNFIIKFIGSEINSQASINRVFLDERLKSAKIDLEESEIKLKVYQEK